MKDSLKSSLTADKSGVSDDALVTPAARVRVAEELLKLTFSSPILNPLM
jgi:hypothetical protein